MSDIQQLKSSFATDKLVAMKLPQMRVSQLAFLKAIALKPGSTQTEICQELGVTMSAISRNVDVFGTGKAKSDRHKSLGLIEAKRDLDDERLILLYLTDKGRIFLNLILETSYGRHE